MKTLRSFRLRMLGAFLPLQMILATLLGAPYVIWRRRISLPKMLAGLMVVSFVVLFIYSQRSHLYLGQHFKIDLGAITTKVTGEQEPILTGDDFIYPVGLILTANDADRYGWGRRYLVQVIIRPIPRQIWRTKFEDVGHVWLIKSRHLMGYTSDEWQAATGWVPVKGAALGFAADLFMEFSWGCFLFAFLFGRFYGRLWLKARMSGGIWTLLYLEAMILSVYVPTQSVFAMMHQFLIMALPTVLLWQKMVVPWQHRRATSARRARLAIRRPPRQRVRM